MWHKICCKNNLILFLSFKREDNIFIYVTDYIRLWYQEYIEEDFITCLKNSNFGLEISTDELFKNGIDILSYPINLKNVSTLEESNILKVSICKYFVYPLKLIMQLKLGTSEMFFEQVTQPLLRTIQDLRSSETGLRTLMQCKDKEIEEYKMEAGEICLRYLKTKPYNDVAHMEQHTVYNMNFGSSSIETGLIEKNVNVKKDVVVKQETNHTNNVNVKMEPKSEELDTEAINIKSEIKSEPVHVTIPKKKKIKLNI